MKTILRGLAVLVAGFFLGIVPLQSAFGQAADARAEIDAGVTAYKSAQYQDATKHFKNAATLDPQNVDAHRYLAISYAQQYIPGVATPENDNYAQQAINEYSIVLELDPSSMNSVKGIAYLEFERKHFDKAKEYYRKAIDLDANDAETYYSLGVLDWTAAYGERMKLRAAEKLKPNDPFVNNPKCEELKESNEDNVKDGIDMLNKAIQLRRDYDDAMAYMNLMYREKADIECNDVDAYAKDLETADHWVDMTMATKKGRGATPVHSRVPLSLPIQK